MVFQNSSAVCDGVFNIPTKTSIIGSAQTVLLCTNRWIKEKFGRKVF